MCDSDDGVIEHLAGIEDYLLAMAILSRGLPTLAGASSCDNASEGSVLRLGSGSFAVPPPQLGLVAARRTLQRCDAGWDPRCDPRDELMKKITLLALMAGAIINAASSQEIYLDIGPNAGPRYRDYDEPRYRDWYDEPRYRRAWILSAGAVLLTDAKTAGPYKMASANRTGATDSHILLDARRRSATLSGAFLRLEPSDVCERYARFRGGLRSRRAAPSRR
jgi:hypothetical protein